MPAGRRQRELVQRKQFILDRCRTLFFREGFENVTIEAICKEVEYGRSAIYGLFRSKEEILAHIKLEALDLLRVAFETELPAATNHAQNLDALIQKAAMILYDFSNRETQYFRTLFLSPPPEPGKVSAELNQKIREATVQVARPLTEGIAARSPAKVRDRADELVHVFWASLVGLLSSFQRHETLPESEGEVRKSVTLFAHIFSRGLTEIP
ncbi:MAG: TetR/AcrR family transcriptional regulator [Spirochaetales bacterium]|nr:TetR/AcrR family transcriptional regulator [Leptospiraceae bacterium]MCP5479840.1 TetR/AcrR family transcriptional regulator [Spirochaetales bacterium]MCP5486230.1 TetR/AcrR family transcriptional regulator [Spirochaetales bacterium]